MGVFLGVSHAPITNGSAAAAQFFGDLLHVCIQYEKCVIKLDLLVVADLVVIVNQTTSSDINKTIFARPYVPRWRQQHWLLLCAVVAEYLWCSNLWQSCVCNCINEAIAEKSCHHILLDIPTETSCSVLPNSLLIILRHYANYSKLSTSSK